MYKKELKLIQKFPDMLKQQGKYPVIYIDFKTAGKLESYEVVQMHTRDCLIKSYEEHDYLY